MLPALEPVSWLCEADRTVRVPARERRGMLWQRDLGVTMDRGYFARLAARRDSTALAMRNAMVRQVPLYGALSSTRQVALLGEIHDTWRPVLKQAAKDEPLTEADLEPYRILGRNRGMKSFPLGELRAGFEVAHTTGLRECLSMIEPGDGGASIAFTAWGVRELPRIMSTVESAYARACGTAGDRSQARQLLMDRLTQGRPAGDVASALGTELPSGYLVLLCKPRGDGPDCSFRGGLPTGQLDSVPGLLWQADHASGGLLVLLPVEASAAAARATARGLVTSLANALGRRLSAAEAHGATLDDVPAAVHDARQSLALVGAMPDAESRPYGADELLVELAVARQPAVRRKLTELLAPLQRGTDLQRTLEVLFDCGLDRQRTTAALHIHRRSLTYRIQRIRELTGLDPTTAHGIQLLRAALTATRLPATLTSP